jgi:ketosteroid isomerase-like protein
LRDPGFVPDAEETAVRQAGQALPAEYFARIDRVDLDGAVELYREDATFLGVRGRPQIRQRMEQGLAPNAGRRSRHVIANLRSSLVDRDTLLVEYTAVAYTLDGSSPVAARSVFDQEMVIRRGPDGRLRIADHRIIGFEPPAK